MTGKSPQASARSARGSKLSALPAEQLGQALMACIVRLGKSPTYMTGLRDVRKLNELAREMELRFVMGARQEGLTWSQIGARTDLTKQGAQQFYTRDRQRLLTADEAAAGDDEKSKAG